MDLIELMGKGLIMGPNGILQAEIIPNRATPSLGCMYHLIVNLLLFSSLPQEEEKGARTHVVVVGIS